MTTKTILSAQGRTQPQADTLDGSRNSLPTGRGIAESDGKFRDFAVVCAWAIVGIILTMVAALWFGLEIQ
jgi:hypothetical protein